MAVEASADGCQAKQRQGRQNASVKNRSMITGGVALFGGSFNPIHMGHLIAARSVGEHLAVNRVVLIPSASPPHKRGEELADAADRLEMARLAVADDPFFTVSDVEVRRSGPSFTVWTVEQYRRELGPQVPLYWIIGADSLPELHSWFRIAELVELCDIVTAVRPGYDTPDLAPLRQVLPPEKVQRLSDSVLPTPRIDISATEIRQRIRTHRPVRYLVPERVREYIEQRRLYKVPSS